MAEQQAILRSLPKRPQTQTPPASPPHNLAHLRGEVQDCATWHSKYKERGCRER